MTDKIYYKLSKCEIHSLEHFYKMYRFVWFKTFVFCLDIYPEEINFSLLITHSNVSRLYTHFNIWSIK